MSRSISPGIAAWGLVCATLVAGCRAGTTTDAGPPKKGSWTASLLIGLAGDRGYANGAGTEARFTGAFAGALYTPRGRDEPRYLFVADAIVGAIRRIDLYPEADQVCAQCNVDTVLGPDPTVAPSEGDPLIPGRENRAGHAARLEFPNALAIVGRKLYVLDDGVLRVSDIPRDNTPDSSSQDGGPPNKDAGPSNKDATTSGKVAGSWNEAGAAKPALFKLRPVTARDGSKLRVSDEDRYDRQRSAMAEVDNVLYIAHQRGIWRYDPKHPPSSQAQWRKTPFAGSVATGAYDEQKATQKDGRGTAASFAAIRGLTAGPNHTLLVADRCLIRSIDLKTRQVAWLAGKRTADKRCEPNAFDGSSELRFGQLHGLAYDGANSELYAVDQASPQIQSPALLRGFGYIRQLAFKGGGVVEQRSIGTLPTLAELIGERAARRGASPTFADPRQILVTSKTETRLHLVAARSVRRVNPTDPATTVIEAGQLRLGPPYGFGPLVPDRSGRWIYTVLGARRQLVRIETATGLAEVLSGAGTGSPAAADGAPPISDGSSRDGGATDASVDARTDASKDARSTSDDAGVAASASHRGLSAQLVGGALVADSSSSGDHIVFVGKTLVWILTPKLGFDEQMVVDLPRGKGGKTPCALGASGGPPGVYLTIRDDCSDAKTAKLWLLPAKTIGDLARATTKRPDSLAGRLEAVYGGRDQTPPPNTPVVGFADGAPFFAISTDKKKTVLYRVTKEKGKPARATKTFGDENEEGCSDGPKGTGKLGPLTLRPMFGSGKRLFFADTFCHAVRMFDVDTGVVTTLAGDRARIAFSKGNRRESGLGMPLWVAHAGTDASEAVYVTDDFDDILVKIDRENQREDGGR